MRLTFIIVFVILGAIVSIAEGQTLQLVKIPGYTDLKREDVAKMMKVSSYYFKELGIVFRVKTTNRKIPCLTENGHKWADSLKQIECIRQDLIARGETPKRRKLIYVIVPRWDSETQQGAIVGGRAIAICGDVAIGSGDTLPTFPGVPSHLMNGVLLAHEVVHLMCGNHQLSKLNLMHPAALSVLPDRWIFPNKKLPVLRITKREVKRWYAQTRKES